MWSRLVQALFRLPRLVPRQMSLLSLVLLRVGSHTNSVALMLIESGSEGRGDYTWPYYALAGLLTLLAGYFALHWWKARGSVRRR